MTRDLKNLRILLIGGAGFIGHSLALCLKELGADVHIVDGLAVNNLMTFVAEQQFDESARKYRRIVEERLRLLKDAKVPVTVDDARDYHRLCKFVKGLNPQVFVHLAAVAHSSLSNKDPHSTFDHSFRTLENALDAARFLARSGDEHFIYLSSSMVYGDFTSGEVIEESPCEPVGIYGALKLGGEKLVIAYNQVFDFPFTIIRPSAVYGERDVGRRVVQRFVESAMEKKEITIHGDGSDTMDFTHVQDLVSGLVKVIQNDGARNQILNLTYGRARSLNELAELVKKHFPDVELKYQPRDRLMPRRGTLSIEKAKRALGYVPQFPLEEGLARYVSWYESGAEDTR